MIVIDASAAVDFLIRSDERSRWIGERIRGESMVQVPAVFDVEVLHSLRGLEAAGAMSEALIAVALTGFTALRANRHDGMIFRSRIWALRRNLTAYDAAYVALAEALDAPLLTSDARLARSSGHGAAIELPPV